YEMTTVPNRLDATTGYSKMGVGDEESPMAHKNSESFGKSRIKPPVKNGIGTSSAIAPCHNMLVGMDMASLVGTSCLGADGGKKWKTDLSS
ncbi:MAG: hypothetical protein ABSG38_02200, partial [Spirochaetia bacterium]